MALWWIIIIIQQIVALVLCIKIGQEKNRIGFLYGFFLGFFGLLVLAILPPLEGGGYAPRGKSPNQRYLSSNEKKCKSCGSIITDDYKRCPNCGSGEFSDGSMDVDLSAAGKVAINSGEDNIICPFCKVKIKLDIPVSGFKAMNCTKCNNKITSKNVLFED